MSDLVVYGLVVLSFAVGVTAYVAVIWGLAGRAPRRRALIAVAVLPLGLYWAGRERMWVRCVTCGLALVVYAVARWLGRH